MNTLKRLSKAEVSTMAKGPIYQKIWGDLSDERKASIQKRADQLESEYLSLQEFRKSAGLTQVIASEQLNMSRSNFHG